MAKYLEVTMPDGSVWAVPAKLIAEDRAKFYANGAEEFRAEVEFALSARGKYSLLDWAAENMNWENVQAHARQVSPPPPPDMQDGWVNGDKRVVEMPD